MKKNIKPVRGRQAAPKPIRGRQVTPNPIGPECIEVTKVYDWVALTNRYQNKVQIPAACFTLIQECRADGGNVTATCTVEVPAPPDPVCNVIDTRPGNVPDVPGAQIVTLAFNAVVRVQFFCNGDPIPGCILLEPISFLDDVLLCFPEGTEINCNIFFSDCRVILNQVLGDMVSIEVVLCKEVRVTAPVVLEVEAKFCGPRPFVPMPPDELRCPPFPNFPEQCPALFPPDNCLCQGFGELEDFAATIAVIDPITNATADVAGEIDLTAIICDQCTLSRSRFNMTFTDFPQPSPTPDDPTVDQSFTFVATQFNQPDCTVTGVLTVTGFGTFTMAGQLPENAQFLLILDDVANTIEFIIFEQSGVDELAAGVLTVTEAQVDVGPCERFPG